MKPETVRAALHTVGLKPQASRLLAHMADVANERALFYERRERTVHYLGMSPDTIKRAFAELIQLGYVSEESPAVSGRRTRTLRLYPDRWPQPGPAPGAEPEGSEPDRDPSAPPGPELARRALSERRSQAG